MDNLKINDEVEVTIKKLVYEGAGLAKIDNFTIFVEGAVPEDVLKIKIVSLNKNFAKAIILEIIAPSQHRIKPKCSMANICGGCQWQHIDYSEQIKQKRSIVQETIKKIAQEDVEVKPVIESPVLWNFRHKVQYPLGQTKVSRRVLAGYYKKNTHELINIKHCELQPEIIELITQDVRDLAQKLSVTIYDETKHVGELKHIVFRHSMSKKQCLLVFVVNAQEPSQELLVLANTLFKKYDDITGVLVNFNDKKTNVILGKETKLLLGQDFYEEELEDKIFQIGANSFFQVNPKSAVNIFNIVKNMIKDNTENPSILDAYSGVGNFGIWCADFAREVFCVEENQDAIKFAKQNIEINEIQNVSIFEGDVAKTFEEFKEYKKEFDAVILDPPRKGAGEKVLDDVVSFKPKIIVYVSCNPATLARDLKYLHTKNYKTAYVQPVDMFCHSYHIESIALLFCQL